MLDRNFEHASSEANAEFRNASNIFVYSLKSEGEWRDLIYHGALNNPGVALWVRNCSEVPLLRARLRASCFAPFFMLCRSMFSVLVVMRVPWPQAGPTLKVCKRQPIFCVQNLSVLCRRVRPVPPFTVQI